jgi:hypothetical protein
MFRGKTCYCDRCGDKQRGNGAEIILTPKSDTEIEHIDLCAECWQAFKLFMKREVHNG